MRCAGVLLAVVSACHTGTSHIATDAALGHEEAASTVRTPLPLAVVAEVPLPGAPTRFDYQDLDVARGHLVIAHMSAGTVVVVDAKDGALVKEISNVPTARGVAVAPEENAIFVTSSPNQVVVIDAITLGVVRRVTTGNGPDGIAWDPKGRILGVSDQRDGAISLIADAGRGARTAVSLGAETGNVVFDGSRGVFWIAVVSAKGASTLVAVDAVAAKVTATLALSGCEGGHGVKLTLDAKSAFVACESNETLARVELDGPDAVTTGKTGADPDVLALDPTLGWLYVAAESGDLTVFDWTKPGVVPVGRQATGAATHSAIVDPATHRLFLPMRTGPKGSPVLRIMRPAGT